MPGDIISIQAGQCGNEIGNEFWKRICEEHCIGTDGYATLDRIPDDYCSAYFSEADDNRFIPRAVLIDLEPRVVNSTLNAEFGRIFNLERVFSSGGGAGNNWASGYGAGWSGDTEIGEQIMNVIQSECEISDKIDGFSLSHSIAGGTGSGLGSWILEKLVDDFGTKQINTFSVFPSQGSDVVVQPYNAILTLKRLIEIPQMVTVLDNEAIIKNAMAKLRIANPSMKDVNALIGRIMAGLTAPIRFGAPNFVSLFNLSSHLCPVYPMHFIQCGVAPLTPTGPRFFQQTTPDHLMKFLSRADCMMSSTFNKYSPAQTDCLISGLVLFQGDIDKRIAQDSILQTNRKSPYGCPLVPFFDIQYCTSYSRAKSRSAVIALNHSNFEKTLSSILQQFDAMFRSKAYIKNFEKEAYFQDGLQAMIDARDIVDGVRKIYSDPWLYCSGGRQEVAE